MKQENYSLLAHNTFGIDVKAACFLEYHSVDELRRLPKGLYPSLTYILAVVVTCCLQKIIRARCSIPVLGG